MWIKQEQLQSDRDEGVHSDIQGNCAAAFDISGRTVAFVLNEKKIVYCFVCNT